MDLTPVEQAVPNGNADTTPADSAQAAAPVSSGLTKTAYDAVPSLADAIKARMAGTGSSVTHPVESNTSAITAQPVADASPTDSSGQTVVGDSSTSADGTTVVGTPSEATTEPSVPAAETPPAKLTRSQRRAARLQQLQEAQTAGTPPPPATDDEDDDDFLVNEVQRAMEPLAAKVQELASTITSVSNPGPVPPDVAKLNESYIEKFGDDQVFNDLADTKVKNSRVLSLEEDERLATWAENRLVRDLQTAKIQRDVSAVLLGVAVNRGVDAEAITRAPNLAAACEAIWTAGHTAGQSTTVTKATASQQEALNQATAKQQELSAQLATVNAANEALKTSNQAISEELEALREQAPAFARKLVTGGLASLVAPNGVTPLDASRQSGRQMLIAAAQNMARQKTGSGPAVRNR